MKEWCKVCVIVLICGCLLAGCNKKKETATTDADGSAEVTEAVATEAVTEAATEAAKEAETTPEAKEEKTYTVTFYDSDATTVLSTAEVKEGECAAEYTPEKADSKFVDWYAVKTLNIEYDFTKPVTKDISIYAGFIKNQDDTRKFALVGSGKSPLLLASSWGTNIEENDYMTKEEGANNYTITCDLYEGDQFQFVINTKWEDQRGAGYMLEKSADGVKCFDGEGQKDNLTCLKDGNYTFTLTTYPSADLYNEKDESYKEEKKENFNYNPYDTITFSYNGPVADKMELQTSYFIKGAKVTEWKDLFDEQYKMQESEGKAILVATLTKGEEFLFTSQVSDGKTTSAGTEFIKFDAVKEEESLKLVEGAKNGNIVAKEAGIYTFTYDIAAKELTVAYTKE